MRVYTKSLKENDDGRIRVGFKVLWSQLTQSLAGLNFPHSLTLWVDKSIISWFYNYDYKYKAAN